MTDQRHPVPSPADTALAEAGCGPLRAADPSRIGPYVPLGLLGSGGMGHVYLARPADSTPGLVAVKVIRPEYADDAHFRRRFAREAAVHSRVHTPRMPRLFGTGFDDSLLWMATQFLPGMNLAEAVRECGRLDRAGMWRLTAELGQALAALSAAGVVHRDLKPSNVILSLQGVCLIDFGIAQAADGTAITSTGSRLGTPAFMAPEYLREGHCDTASDAFSLAGSLVFAATGRAPFGDGTGVDVMHRVAFEEPRPELMAELVELDSELAALLASCLAKEPAARPVPGELIEAAEATHGTPRSWHDALTRRLSARQQACEVLERVAVADTVRLRKPVRQGVLAGAAVGQGPVFGQQAMSTPVTPPVTLWQQPADTPRSDGARTRRKTLLTVVVSVAVGAFAVGAFLFARPSGGAPSVSPLATASPMGDVGVPPSSEPATPGDGSSAGTAPTASPTTPTAPPWTSQCTYYNGTEVTLIGNRGQRVVQVQCMLTRRGYGVGPAGVDGEFGTATLAAVKRFQSARHLEVDGVVGPQTWAALRSSA